MATYTDISINQDTGIGSGKIDGILFSSVNLADGYKLIRQPKIAPDNSIFDPSGTGTSKNLIINAVDIDWNGAKPGIGENSTNGITTTGELLSLIKAIHTKANGSYALSSHTHALAIEKQTSGDAAISLTANTLYKLTAGGSTLLFKTPIDNTGSAADGNTTYKFKVNETWHGDTINGVDLSGGGITIPTQLSQLNNDSGFTTNSGTVTSVEIQAGTNISVDNTAAITTSGTRTISHATPTGANASIKGSKSGPLLASITTDAQGHVTAYDTIDKTGLRDLIKSYFAPIPPTLTGISVSGEGLESYYVYPNESTKWNTGTVTATYSDGTSKIITGNVEPTLSSSNTNVATVSGNKITTVVNGSTILTATYTYTENGVNKELPITKTLNVSAISKELEYISWESIRPVSGNVGDDVDFGYIQMWFKNSEADLIPFSDPGITLYTDSACTTVYNKNNTYTNQPVWARFEGSFKTKYSKKVTLTPKPATLSSISVTGYSLASSEIYVGNTTSWTKGTVTATYSDNTSKDVTSSATFTLSSSDTNVATVSGNIITAKTTGSPTITATYRYTENSVTKTKKVESSLNVVTQKLKAITWENYSLVSGNVGDNVDFGNIKLWFSGNTTSLIPYNTPGVELYTNIECTIPYNKNTQYTNQYIYAKYGDQTTTDGKPVTLTPSKTYYMYVGTTKPTSLSQASTVSSYPTEQTYTNNSGAKSHIFVLTNSDKTVVFINPQMNAPVSQLEVDTTTISGYKIWETAVGTANGGSIKIQIS